jgi:hypothetical protein
MPGKRMVKKHKVRAIPAHLKCVWGLICSMSAIDQQKNNISLFNVIDQLNIPKTEFEKLTSQNDGMLLPIPHELVLLWRRALELQFCDEELKTDIKLSLIDPRGKIISETLTPLHFPARKRSMRFRMQVGAFKITTKGDYVYRVEVVQPNTTIFTKVLEVPLQVAEIDAV